MPNKKRRGKQYQILLALIKNGGGCHELPEINCVFCKKYFPSLCSIDFRSRNSPLKIEWEIKELKKYPNFSADEIVKLLA